jgi:hypothetical protein
MEVRRLNHFTAFLVLGLFVGILLSPLPAEGQPKRGKVIDFEDEVVEGMNKRPLDSLSQISENGRKRKKPHLYRKRVAFGSETRVTLHSLQHSPGGAQ